MWAHIAEEVQAAFNIVVNGLQVETRFRCVMKRTKKAIDNNNKSGAVRVDPEYETEMLEIVRNDDSLFPPYTINAGNIHSRTSLLLPSTSTEPQPSTSTEPQPSTPYLSSSYTSDDEFSSGPVRKKRKTTQEQLMENFFEEQQKKITAKKEIMNEFLENYKIIEKEKADAKKKYNLEKEQAKQKRHEDKINILKHLH